MGRSGCGKSTQSNLLIEYLSKIDPSRKTLCIQTGDGFREFIKGEGVTNKISAGLNETGGLQPDFLAVYIWSKILIEKYDGRDHIITDGVARKFHEAGILDSIFLFYKLEKPYVVYLDVHHDESTRRLIARGRKDDTHDNIKKRLSWYDAEVEKSLEFYRKNKDYTFLDIDGHKTPEEVHAEIISKIS